MTPSSPSDADEGSITRLLGYLREKQTLWVKDHSDELLRQRIRWGFARARSHGFAWEASLYKFVGLMFRWAPNFDEHPMMARVLERRDVPSEERADLLFDLPTEAWEEARESYDPAAWEWLP
jgi:hypothetical protein